MGVLRSGLWLFTMTTTALVSSAASAAAQAPAPSAPPAAAAPSSPPPSSLSTTWNNGLSFGSADGGTKLQLGTLIQVDGRFAADDPSPITDAFLIRRGRFLFQGRVARYFEFTFVPDFAGNTLTLFDAYIDTKYSNAFRVRAGKSKAPIGLEQLYPDAGLPFAERSVATNLAPNRDVGLTAVGDFLAGHLSYTGGVVNGVPDAASGDTDTNDSKDLVGRVTITHGPFGAAVGGSHGRESGALSGFKSTSQQTFFSYASGVTANGIRDRVSPSAFVYYKSVGGFAEYLRTSQAIAKAGTTSDTTNHSWNVTGVWIVTGEAASPSGVTPRTPFDPAHGHWGALQLAVRASSLTVDPRAFDLGLAATGSSRTARSFGVSAIWYDTVNVKHVLTFERTVFDDDANGPRKAEHAIIFRIQLNLAPRL